MIKQLKPFGPISATTMSDKIEVKPGYDIETVFGDEQQEQFYPRVKVKQWNNECNFSIGVVSSELGSFTEKDGVVEWSDSKQSAKIYKADKILTLSEDVSIGEEGGFELELIIPSKPSSNRFSFSLQTKNVRFCFQPPLTQDEVNEGCERPPHVDGSYAIFRADNKQSNQYMTGKVGHIYRPVVYDSLGEKVWADLELEDDYLTVVVPQKFLDKAQYPITIDPTIGYTTAGASSDTNYLTVAVGGFSLGVTGDFTAVTAYFDKGSGDRADCYGVIYADNGSGAPAAILALSANNTDAAFATLDWHELTLSETITSQTIYPGISVGNNTSRFFRFDTDASVDGFENESDPAPPADPFVPVTRDSRKYSIYATYTEVSSGWAHGFSGVANAAISKINGIAIASISKVNGVA